MKFSCYVYLFYFINKIKINKIKVINIVCHRKCGSFNHELFVSKTRTSEVRVSEGF